MALVEFNKDPSRRELQWFGLLVAVFFGLIGLVAYRRADAPEVARNLWLIGVALALLYYAMPPVRKPMFVGWMALAFPIGWTISHIILGVSYYLVLTPIGLIMRLTGRDPMQRRLEPDAPTYWVEHDPETDASRYFRQF